MYQLQRLHLSYDALTLETAKNQTRITTLFMHLFILVYQNGRLCITVNLICV